MLHERTDFPPGTTRYTAGWRAVGASLSDVAAMGPRRRPPSPPPHPSSIPSYSRSFAARATSASASVPSTSAATWTDTRSSPSRRPRSVGRTSRFSGRAQPGDRVCVTGTLGRSAAALTLFERAGEDETPAEEADRALEQANELFRFVPRIEAGLALASRATAAMDSSDGLARSLHQLAEASDCRFAIDSEAIPIDDAVRDVCSKPESPRACDDVRRGLRTGRDRPGRRDRRRPGGDGRFRHVDRVGRRSAGRDYDRRRRSRGSRLHPRLNDSNSTKLEGSEPARAPLLDDGDQDRHETEDAECEREDTEQEPTDTETLVVNRFGRPDRGEDGGEHAPDPR